MKYIRSFFMSLSMFSVIPAPKYKWDDKNVRHILKFYPFVGAIIGGLWYLIYMILNYFSINYILMSAILVAFPVYITGMLHLDGFMDVSDAILSRRDRETKIKILKDSCTGAFSVISLVILIMFEYASINTILLEKKEIIFIIFIPIISRSFSALMILINKDLKASTLTKFFKENTNKFDRILQIIIISILIIIIYLLLGIKYDIILVIMCICMFYKTYKNVKDLDGINGDVAGYCLITGELVGLITLALI